MKLISLRYLEDCNFAWTIFIHYKTISKSSFNDIIRSVHLSTIAIIILKYFSFVINLHGELLWICENCYKYVQCIKGKNEEKYYLSIVKLIIKHLVNA